MKSIISTNVLPLRKNENGIGKECISNACNILNYNYLTLKVMELL